MSGFSRNRPRGPTTSPKATSPTSAPSASNQDSNARLAATSGEQLPMLDQVQEQFGEHSLSGVNFVGGQAGADASDALGVEAVASGNTIVSGSNDPHTIAHEAAHVVQQRGGGVGGAKAEAHADAVADAVTAGQSAAPLLDQVASPSQTTPSVNRADPMKKAGAAVDISTLSPRDVLNALDTVARYGEPGVAGDTEFEAGDTAALAAIRDAAGFGAAEIAGMHLLLTGGNAALETVRNQRHVAVALPAFQAIYAGLAADDRVVGLNEWAVENSVYVDKINSGVAAEVADGCQQLLDSLNELRSLQAVLANMAATDTLDVREVAIHGTIQTADGTVNNDAGAMTKQIEVKTVRAPIPYGNLSGVTAQLGAGLGKFTAAGAGNFEVHVFASYSEAGNTTTAMGPYTKTEGINRAANSFDRTSTKPGYGQTTLVRDQVLAYLNAGHKANPTLSVFINIENAGAAPATLTCTHAGAGADWV